MLHSVQDIGMTRPHILLMRSIIASAQKQLESAYVVHRYDTAPDRDALVRDVAPRVRAIATRGDYPLPGALMERLPNVRIIASSGTGYDGIDVAAARRLGIEVTNSPSAAADCVADAAWSLLLATMRRTAMFDRMVRAGKWMPDPPIFTDRVWGERMGILGLGAIGRAIARRAEGFGMDIAYHGRHRRDDVPYRYYDTAVELAHNVKILMVAVPGGAVTHRLVGRDVIDALGPSGYLVNVSRGSVVDEACLVDALTQGRLAGAGLDVFADEPRVPPGLLALDNVVLTPHAASGTQATRDALGQFVVDNLAAFFAGRPLVSPI
jgi:lactate dehydrogenase-like 2-hydroxyacid dehydrogenase